MGASRENETAKGGRRNPRDAGSLGDFRRARQEERTGLLESQRRVRPYVCTKPIVFEVVKDGQSRTVTIDPKHADSPMPIYGFPFALMAGGGGRIKIK